MKNIGLLLIRLCVGAVFILHGAQKLFGDKIGLGGGFDATTEAFGKMGFDHARVMAGLAGCGEFFGGILLVLGLLTRVGGGLIAITMAVAVFKVHWDHGFFGMNGGFEYPLTLLVCALAFVLGSPGPLAVDNWIKLKKAPPEKK